MKLKKLLSVAILLAGALGANAQTDVTDTYLVNADFEDEYENFWTGDKRAIFKPNGWTVTRTNPNENDMSILNSSDVASSNFSAWTINDEEKRGKNTYWVRLRWGGQVWKSSGTTGNPTDVQLQQLITLPEGVYKLSADLLSYAHGTEANNHTYLIAKSENNERIVEPTINHNKSDNNWENKSLLITSSGKTEYKVTLQCLQNWQGTGEYISGFDNVKLEKYEVTQDNSIDITSVVGTAREHWAGSSGSYNIGSLATAERYFEDQYRTGDMMTQTIKDLPLGLYEVELYANANWTPDRGNIKTAAADVDAEVSSVFANNVTVPLPLAHQINTAEAGVYKLSGVKVIDGTLTMGLRNDAEGANWMLIQIKSLKYIGPDLSIYQEALSTALNNARNVNQDQITDAMVNKLNSAIDNAENVEQTQEAIQSATTQLNSVLASIESIKEPYLTTKSFISICEDYIANSTEIEAGAKTAFSVAVSTAKTEVEATTTADAINAINSTLETARQEYVVKAYPINETTFDYTFKIRNATFNGTSDGWVNGSDAKDGGGDYRLNTVQGKTCWNSWDNSFNSMDIHQDITGLPDGIYKVRCKAITQEERLKDQHAYAKSSTGTVVSPNMTIANFTSPEGWETLTTADATVMSDGKLTIGFASTSGGAQTGWFCVTDFELVYVRALTDEDYMPAALAVLSSSLDAANALNTTVNVGDDVFQIPTSAVNTLNTAIGTAQGVYDAAESTLAEVEEVTETLNNAIEAYKNVELNAPNSEVAYKIYQPNGFEFSKGEDSFRVEAGAPITFVEGGNSESDGYFGITWEHADNVNYAQALSFTKVEGNLYKISFVDATNTTRYIATQKGAGYMDGGNVSTRTDRLRVTTDAEKALKVEVVPTQTEGLFNFKNTEANALIGGTDFGVYTTGTNSSLAVKVAEKATVSGSLDAGKYATRIFPFIPTLPEGVKAYEFGGTNGNYITLAEVETPTANVPYILYNETEETIDITLSGYGLATEDVYEVNNLTGTYLATATTVPANSYVLQTEDGVQQFRTVGEETDITMPYRAYLNVPAGGEIKAFFFGGETTGIEAIDALTSGNVEAIYTVNGAKVNSLQKGMNIVKLSNGKVQKVLVK